MTSLFADPGPLALLLRGLALALLLAAGGGMVFHAMLGEALDRRLGAGEAVTLQAGLGRLQRASIGGAIVALILWFAAEAASMGAATSAAEVARAGWVALTTRFGLVVLAQVGLLTLAGLGALGRSRPAWPAVLAAAAAVLLQAGHGHGLAQADPWIGLAGLVHVGAAAAWLGALPTLLLIVARASVPAGLFAARRFSVLGRWAVIALALSAAAQGWWLIGGVPGLFGTPHGNVAIAKLVAFLLLLGFALCNRYRFAPALAGASPEAARRRLVVSILLQCVVGLVALGLAVLIASLPPAAHEQPWWPFAQRPSLVALEDADVRAEVTGALLGLAGIVALLLGTLSRRLRWPSLALALAGLWLVLPHFAPLLVPAYPTSFYRSPTGFAATGIAEGARLYQSECAACHGAGGRGDGPRGVGLSVPPADLTAPHLWEHADGELFWWLSHGMEAPDGTLVMPGTRGRLDAAQRWAVIDFLRARNAGLALRAQGGFPVPLPAPQIGLACADGWRSSSDLRGRVLHLVTSAAAAGAAADLPREVLGVPVVTVRLGRDGAAAPPARGCAATDPAAWTAYALVAGVPPESLEGVEFLVDPQGWVRSAQRPAGGVLPWRDRAAFVSAVGAICTTGSGGAAGRHSH